MAKCTPSMSRPGMGRLLGTVEPMARTVASKPWRAVRASLPTSTPHWNEMPSSSMSLMRRATVSLSNFIFGMP